MQKVKLTIIFFAKLLNDKFSMHGANQAHEWHLLLICTSLCITFSKNEKNRNGTLYSTPSVHLKIFFFGLRFSHFKEKS